jgi:cellobiose phosphorylase
VKNPNGKESGISQLVLDGSPVEGNIIKATPGKHTVEVVM